MNVKLIDASQIDTSKASILSKVTIKNKITGKEVIYTLVSEAEADLKTGKVSISSPLGKGLLGKAIGETAYVNSPNGKIEFEVLHIGA